MVLKFIIFLLLLTIFYFYQPYLLRLLQQWRLQHICARNRWLVLTYDGGPGTDLTPQLLDLFLEKGIKVAFFPSGLRADKNRAIMDRIAAEGHEIGCHAQEHLNAWKTLPWKAVRDIAKGYQTLSRWISKDAVFRPPYGKMNSITVLWLWARGAPTLYWTIDIGDTAKTMPSPQEAADKVIQSGAGVLLMHDHDEGRSPARIKFVVQATRLILENAEKNAIKICPLHTILFHREKTSRSNAQHTRIAP